MRKKIDQHDLLFCNECLEDAIYRSVDTVFVVDTKIVNYTEFWTHMHEKDIGLKYKSFEDILQSSFMPSPEMDGPYATMVYCIYKNVLLEPNIPFEVKQQMQNLLKEHYDCCCCAKEKQKGKKTKQTYVYLCPTNKIQGKFDSGKIEKISLDLRDKVLSFFHE